MRNQEGSRRYYRQKRKWYIPVVILALLVVLGTQFGRLVFKLNDYRQREASLEQQLELAKAREKELADYEAYTTTDEYVENTAHSKLGMVKENEIIFKEK